MTFITAEPRSQVERSFAVSYDFSSIMLFTTMTSKAGNIYIGDMISFSSAVVELPVVPSCLFVRITFGSAAL